MGRRGQRPQPTVLKIMRGNPGHRPLNPDEPHPEICRTDPPQELDQFAQDEWRRVIDELVTNRLMTSLYRAALAGYCQAWSNWVQAELKVREHGAVYTTQTGTQKPSPWVARAQAERAAMRQFAAEFGMSPSSSTGVRSSPSEPKDQLKQHLARRPKAPNATTA